MGGTINTVTNLVICLSGSFMYFDTWLISTFCQTLPVFCHRFFGIDPLWWKVWFDEGFAFSCCAFQGQSFSWRIFTRVQLCPVLCARYSHPGPCLIWFCLLFLLFFFSNTEKLGDRKLNVAEVTQSEIGQKQKLQTVLEAVHDLLRPHGWTIKWNVDCKELLCFLSQLRGQGVYDNQ